MSPEELDETPPKSVDPNVLAFREWVSTHSRLYGQPINLDLLFDAFLAGARMATDRERERAKETAR